MEGNERNNGVEILIGYLILPSKETFRYMASVLPRSRIIDEDETHHIKYFECSGGRTHVSCATRKYDSVELRPTMLYES